MGSALPLILGADACQCLLYDSPDRNRIHCYLEDGSASKAQLLIYEPNKHEGERDKSGAANQRD